MLYWILLHDLQVFLGLNVLAITPTTTISTTLVGTENEVARSGGL